jgi:cleavage and polyadenylation specificity factor subunit 3
VLLPVFQVGRVQELLAILDEYWQNHTEMQGFKIYYISTIGKNYKSLTERFITYVDNENTIGKNEPAVVFCTPGMLQSGVSRKLFEDYANNEKNLLLITGYGASGSLLH